MSHNAQTGAAACSSLLSAQDYVSGAAAMQVETVRLVYLHTYACLVSTHNCHALPDTFFSLFISAHYCYTSNLHFMTVCVSVNKSD